MIQAIRSSYTHTFSASICLHYLQNHDRAFPSFRYAMIQQVVIHGICVKHALGGKTISKRTRSTSGRQSYLAQHCGPGGRTYADASKKESPKYHSFGRIAFEIDLNH
jgi:hypothetical protein